MELSILRILDSYSYRQQHVRTFISTSRYRTGDTILDTGTTAGHIQQILCVEYTCGTGVAFFRIMRETKFY
jgi:hypothetical protein